LDEVLEVVVAEEVSPPEDTSVEGKDRGTREREERFALCREVEGALDLWQDERGAVWECGRDGGWGEGRERATDDEEFGDRERGAAWGRRDGVGVPIDLLGSSSPPVGVPAPILSIESLPLPFLSSFVLTDPALLSSSVPPSSSSSSLPSLPPPLLLLLIELSSVSDSQLDSEKLTGLDERRPFPW
jgi:hypothetical protein